MIDRVPFLPEAVLVCFDTLNVRFKRIRSLIIMIHNRTTCEFIRRQHRLLQHPRPQCPTCSSLCLSRSRAREICGEKLADWLAALCCCACCAMRTAFCLCKQRLQRVHRNARADRLEEVARNERLHFVASRRNPNKFLQRDPSLHSSKRVQRPQIQPFESRRSAASHHFAIGAA
jgi:hypothetical protein